MGIKSLTATKQWKRDYDRKRYLAGLKSNAGAWTKRHPIKSKRYRRDWFLRKSYGISLDDYNQMARKQRKRCAICRRIKPLHVDHCHKTKRVRGLLCFGCNVTLGKVGDDPKILLRFVGYLKRPACA